MAVVHNLNMSLTLKQIGVKAEWLAEMSKSGVKIERQMDCIRFTSPGKEHKFQIASAVVSAAAKHMLPHDSMQVLRDELNIFIPAYVLNAEAPQMYTETSKVSASVLVGSPSDVANIGKFEDTFKPVEIHQPVPVEVDPKNPWAAHAMALAINAPVSQAVIATAPVIPLKAAKHLYTPVAGTGAGSRYFLVAVYPMFQVAVRLKGAKMTVRVEGQLSVAEKKALEMLAFTGHAEHWSNHVVVSDTAEAQRFLGCALASLGSPLTPLPDLKQIAAHGV